MYKITISLLISLTLVSLNAFSQSLSLDNLVSMQKNEKVKLSEFLNDRGWSLIDSKKADTDWLELSWLKESQNIGGFVKVSILKNDFQDIIRVRYATNSKDIYTSIKNNLASKGFRYDESLMDDGLACSNYTDGNTVIMLCNLVKKEGKEDLYAFTVMGYADYAVSYRKNFNTFK